MFRVHPDNVDVQRTLTPLYEQHQATPHATWLDENASKTLYSGMAMKRIGADTVAVYDGTGVPFGLSALDHNNDIDDLDFWSLRPWAVWLGGPDAEFEVTSPAIDANATWTVPTDGTRQLVYAKNDGVLTTDSAATGAAVVAQLLEVINSEKVRIGLLLPSGSVA